MDGEAASAHLEEMNIRGNAWKAKNPSRRNGAILINLLLSEFYDGDQLFTSKVFDFWPLCIGIFNLPATLRGKVGLGYFLGALYTGKHTEVERKLISEFLCEELVCLFDGIEHESNGKKYFIQARLVLHVLDTKAAEPVLGLQSAANSKFGCPLCGGATGLHNGKKCVFYGHRGFLPQHHWLRFFGQTGYCCPHGFYDHQSKNQWRNNEIFWNKEKGFESIRKPFFAPHDYKVFPEIMNKLLSGVDLNTRRNKLFQKHRSEIEAICHPCDGNQFTKDGLIEFLLPSDEAGIKSKYEYKWFHSGEFSLDLVKPHFSHLLFYRHFDFRTRRPYQRTSYSQYTQDALAAIQLNERSRSKKKKHVNGIQSLWYYCRLPYADIERQFTWPFVRITECVLGKFADKKDKPRSEPGHPGHKGKKGPVPVVASDNEEETDEIDEPEGESYDGGHFDLKYHKSSKLLRVVSKRFVLGLTVYCYPKA